MDLLQYSSDAEPTAGEDVDPSQSEELRCSPYGIGPRENVPEKLDEPAHDVGQKLLTGESGSKASSNVCQEVSGGTPVESQGGVALNPLTNDTGKMQASDDLINFALSPRSGRPAISQSSEKASSDAGKTSGVTDEPPQINGASFQSNDAPAIVAREANIEVEQGAKMPSATPGGTANNVSADDGTPLGEALPMKPNNDPGAADTQVAVAGEKTLPPGEQGEQKLALSGHTRDKVPQSNGTTEAAPARAKERASANAERAATTESSSDPTAAEISATWEETLLTMPEVVPSAGENQPTAEVGDKALSPNERQGTEGTLSDPTGEVTQSKGYPKEPAGVAGGSDANIEQAAAENASEKPEATSAEAPVTPPLRGKTLPTKPEAAVENQSSAEIGETPPADKQPIDNPQPNGVTISASDKQSDVEGKGGTNATGATAERGSASSLRGKALPPLRKTFDQVEYSSAYKNEGAVKESDPSASPKQSLSAPASDDLGDSTNDASGGDGMGVNEDENPNDTYLNLKKDRHYKAIMHAQFNTMGRGAKEEERVADMVLQLLKKKGGRIFRLPHHKADYEEADDEAALHAIRWHIRNRNASSKEWMEYKPNDVFLSIIKDPGYKAIMFAQFKKIGLGSRVDESDVNEVLQTLKKRGGRIFIPSRSRCRDYEEADDNAALRVIRGHMKGRNASSRDWYDGNEKTPTVDDSGNHVPKEVVSLLDDETPYSGIRPGRKRQKTQNFAEAQGHDMLREEEQARQRASSKKKRKGVSEKSPASTLKSPTTDGAARSTKKRAASKLSAVQAEPCEELGAGWTKKVVHRKKTSSKSSATKDSYYYSPEGKQFSSMVQAKRYLKEEGAKAGKEQNAPATKGMSGVKETAKAEAGRPGRRNPSQSRSKAATTTGADAKRNRSAGSAQQSVGTTATKPTRPKAKRTKRDDAALESGPSQPAEDGSDARRPKRQSALKARQYLQEHTSLNDEDEDDEGEAPASQKSNAAAIASAATASAVVSSMTKLKQEKEELLKALSSCPPQNEYEEESSWRFHNSPFPKDSQEQLTVLREDTIPCMPAPTTPNELQPLPCAPSLPPLPRTGRCKWSFDEESRVLLANFRENEVTEGKIEVTPEDEVFLFQVMERDDITVISDGLAESINPAFWTRDYIEGCIGPDYHHKFRGFETSREDGPDQQPMGQPKEKEGWYSMKVADYFQYLEQRQSVKAAKSDGAETNGESGLNEEFTFVDSDGDTKSVNVDKESLYMIDVDLVKLLPRAFEDLQRNFKLPGILPGGSHCMMNAINASGRPFMGPNLYITPPCSFTHFHQDGHGTVDSGHLCLAGYNEVVMLRRLTERHKYHALNLLTGTSDAHSTLYGLPHRDNLGVQPGWPSKDAIEQCKTMKYYPSVFVLKPGQVVHINKGRLHAFRKLAPAPLPPTDCHSDLRQEILGSKDSMAEDICFSVAWDWMYKGVTSEGINREVSGILECARLNRKYNLQSLAIPETSLLFLAKENIAEYQQTSNASESRALFRIGNPLQQPLMAVRSEPDAKTVLRGILPSLQYVVNRHNSSVQFSMEWEVKTKHVKDSWRVSIDSKPNAWQNPDSFALDPYGASDFFCKFCNEELSNVYMHCDGCEKLLNKDFNICSTCHMEGKYKVTYQMHPFNSKAHSIVNHTGVRNYLRQSRCPCKNGKECAYCTYCTGCSCRCHQWFTLHYRFMGLKAELDILEQAESIVGANVICHSSETKARLFSLISEKMTVEESNICPVIDDEATNEVEVGAEQKEAAVSVEEADLETKPAALPKGEGTANDNGGEANESSKEESISYHCRLCGRDFKYRSAQAAPGAFSNHTRACQRKHEETEATADDGSPVDEVSGDGESQPKATPIGDPDSLQEGDSVLVECKEGKLWNATIVERDDQDSEAGFRIHYQGLKKQKRAKDYPWIPCTKVYREIDE